MYIKILVALDDILHQEKYQGYFYFIENLDCNNLNTNFYNLLFLVI